MLHVWTPADVAGQNGKIRAGDILGTHAVHAVGAAIEKAQAWLVHGRHPDATELAKIVHVGIVVDNNEFVDVSYPTGVQISALSSLHKPAVVLRPKHYPGTKHVQQLCTLAKSKVGNNYAVSTKHAIAFFKKFFGIELDKPDAYWCSSFVNDIFNLSYGVDSPFNKLKVVTRQTFIPLPADIAAAPGLMSVAP